MFRRSAKVVLLNSVISDMSGSFLLIMFLCLWLMLLLVAVWITATHFSGVSPSSVSANYSASKIVQPELYQTPVDTPVEQRTVFKTATLVYIFTQVFPRYFAPYLSSYSSSYSTRCSQSGGNFLVIPKFYPSVHKSVKQFGNSFVFDAPTVWDALPDEIGASPSLASFR